MIYYWNNKELENAFITKKQKKLLQNRITKQSFTYL